MLTAGSEQVLTVAGTGHDRGMTHVLFWQRLTAEIAADRVRSRSFRMDPRYCGPRRYVREQEKIPRFRSLPAALPGDFEQTSMPKGPGSGRVCYRNGA